MLRSLKYSFVKFLERIPSIQMLVYNNLIFFKFLLPQDKDYLALKKIFKINEKDTFVDIGGNIGLSSASFREIGFKQNEILIFEPNKTLIKNYLSKIKNHYKNLKIFPFGLSDKKEIKTLYQAHYKSLSIHLNNSFSKSYILEKIKNNYPTKYKDFKYSKKKYKLDKFDNINYKKKISFIKIDVEGFDHLVIKGMHKFLKRNKPVFLIEFNKSNFGIIWKILGKNYNCFSYNVDKNNFRRFYKIDIAKLIKGKIFDKKYNKNSINLFLIPKNYKKI
jgi:FkbM family methyltransferase